MSAPGWQPIETAPMDDHAPIEQRLVLVYVPGSRVPDIAWWVGPCIGGPGYWTTGETDSYGDSRPPIEPTHWMPLPPVPEPAPVHAANKESEER